MTGRFRIFGQKMGLIKVLLILSTLLMSFFAWSTASAGGYRGGYHGYYRGHAGVFIGGPAWGPWWYYPYYYPYAYPYNYPYIYPPAVAVPSTDETYTERPQPEPKSQSGIWYYCPESKKYYPYVRGCPTGWQEVPSTPGYSKPGGTGSFTARPDIWYYCPDSRAYYPYVKECPGGWQDVPAQPSSGSGR